MSSVSPVESAAVAPARFAHLHEVTILAVTHWTDSYFSLRTTRPDSLRFENGQFVMLGMAVNDRPLMRAYSIASANWAEYLEFLSIKVPHGELTSRLAHLKPGDKVLVSKKPTGSLLLTDLLPGRNLYLLATGTGLAPFMSIIHDPSVYERFDNVVLAHGVRLIEDLAYREYLTDTLTMHEYLGEMVRARLRYYPVVSRERFVHEGRVTERFANGSMARDLGLAPPDGAMDRAMICGSPVMLKDTEAACVALGFVASAKIGVAAGYVIERAFVER